MVYIDPNNVPLSHSTQRTKSSSNVLLLPPVNPQLNNYWLFGECYWNLPSLQVHGALGAGSFKTSLPPN